MNTNQPKPIETPLAPVPEYNPPLFNWKITIVLVLLGCALYSVLWKY